MSARTTNGLNLDALRETVAAIREIPAAGRFRFRALTRWLSGGRTRTTIRDFHGAGHEQSHGRAFQVESDLPALALGTDRAANPAEYLLAALASCMTAACAYQGAVLGIPLTHVSARVSGDLDLGGWFGARRSGTPVCRGIEIDLEVTTDATDAELDELVRAVRERSSVLDMLMKPVPVRVVAGRSTDEERKEIGDE